MEKIVGTDNQNTIKLRDTVGENSDGNYEMAYAKCPVYQISITISA